MAGVWGLFREWGDWVWLGVLVAPQGLVPLVAIQDGVNIDQSLRAAMAGEAVRAPIFEALLSSYSLGSQKAFTWVP